MVFFFTCSCKFNFKLTIVPEFIIYMGKDKFENESLIAYGLPLDIWFHVDALSSAHVYLRLPENSEYSLDNIPKDVLEECMQLVKHNSIEGCKLGSCKITYTPWENLNKTIDMEVGQVGFKDKKLVRYCNIDKNKDIVKRISKTMVEKVVDLEKEKNEYENRIKDIKKKLFKEQQIKNEELKNINKVIISDKKFEYLQSNQNLSKTNKQMNDDDDFM